MMKYDTSQKHTCLFSKIKFLQNTSLLDLFGFVHNLIAFPLNIHFVLEFSTCVINL